MDMKIEVAFIPVSDVDRAKAFYVDQVGFHADHDHVVNPELRFVQLTPPGSACSIAFGIGLDAGEPGSAAEHMMVVDDVAAARRELADRGVEVSELDEQAWGTFTHFTDPDGNPWSIQQLPAATGPDSA